MHLRAHKISRFSGGACPHLPLPESHNLTSPVFVCPPTIKKFPTPMKAMIQYIRFGHLHSSHLTVYIMIALKLSTQQLTFVDRVSHPYQVEQLQLSVFFFKWDVYIPSRVGQYYCNGAILISRNIQYHHLLRISHYRNSSSITVQMYGIVVPLDAFFLKATYWCSNLPLQSSL